MFSRCILVLLTALTSACSSVSAISTSSQFPVDEGLINNQLFDNATEIQPLLVADLYRLTETMQRELDQAVVPFESSLERLIALRKWVYAQTANYEYDSNLTVPLSALEETGKINCLSFSLLFKAAANYAKIPAEIYFVDTAPAWDTQRNTWVYLQHISIVSKIQGFYSPCRLREIAGIQLDNPPSDKNIAVFVTLQVRSDINPNISLIPQQMQALSDRQLLARYYMNKSAEALGSRNFDLSFAYAKHALDADPNSAEAWNNLGVIYAKVDAFTEARMAYRQALRLNSNLLIAINNLYSAHMRLGETDAALQLIAKNGVNWRNICYPRRQIKPVDICSIGVVIMGICAISRGISAEEKNHAHNA